jgi:DnaK suppressor protein
VKQLTSPKQEFTRFQTLLEACVAELEHGTRHLDAIAVEQSADQIDEVQGSFDRDLAVSKIDRESKQLSEARAGLRRVAEGTFGVCQCCQEDIAQKRLAAIPWAALCISCQDIEDRNRHEKQIAADMSSDGAGRLGSLRHTRRCRGPCRPSGSLTLPSRRELISRKRARSQKSSA